MSVHKAIYRFTTICSIPSGGWTEEKYPTLLVDITKLGEVLTWLGKHHADLVPHLEIQQMPIDCPDGTEWLAYEVALPCDLTPKALVDYLAERYPDWAE